MKFKCVYDGGGGRRLEIGKIYDCYDVQNNDSYVYIITFIDDIGDPATYYTTGLNGKVWFIDATPELREEKINKILNKKDP